MFKCRHQPTLTTYLLRTPCPKTIQLWRSKTLKGFNLKSYACSTFDVTLSLLTLGGALLLTSYYQEIIKIRPCHSELERAIGLVG